MERSSALLWKQDSDIGSFISAVLAVNRVGVRLKSFITGLFDWILINGYLLH